MLKGIYGHTTIAVLKTDNSARKEYRRHIRSSHTGWEYRYGIYLDDGWVYVYRSAVLLARFRYVQEDRFYTIKDVQKSDQSQEVPDIAIGEALKGEPDYR